MKFLSMLLFVVLVAFATTASAAPFAVTGKFTSAAVNKCVFVMNSGAAVEVAPTTFDASNSYCKYDLAAAVTGNNVLNVSYKNVWGSSSVVPFSFAKTLPPTPSDIQLSE